MRSSKSDLALPAYANDKPISIPILCDCFETLPNLSERIANAASASFFIPLYNIPKPINAPAYIFSSSLSMYLSMNSRPPSISHICNSPIEADAAIWPSSLLLNTQSSAPSFLQINRSLQRPAFTKALTYVFARFYFALSSYASPIFLSSRWVLKIESGCLGSIWSKSLASYLYYSLNFSYAIIWFILGSSDSNGFLYLPSINAIYFKIILSLQILINSSIFSLLFIFYATLKASGYYFYVL